MKVRKILVPVDFSEYSNTALEYGLLWGETFGAELTLLHVNTLFHEHYEYDRLMHSYQGIVDKEREQLHRWMKEHAARAAEREVKFRYEILDGRSAAQTILHYVKENPYDLVIIGTHGRSGIKHLLLGSVAEKVSRLSPYPVLTTHKDVEKFRVKNILVPVDFSDYSRQATRMAVDIAREFDARIHLLHVFERANAAHFQWIPETVRPYFDMNPDLRERILEDLQEYKDETIPHWTLEVVEEGLAYREIITYAEEHEIDLIVMATRGYNKFEYFWMWGSTTERVVRLAPCPVLTTRWQDTPQEGEELEERAAIA